LYLYVKYISIRETHTPRRYSYIYRCMCLKIFWAN